MFQSLYNLIKHNKKKNHIVQVDFSWDSDQLCRNSGFYHLIKSRSKSYNHRQI